MGGDSLVSGENGVDLCQIAIRHLQRGAFGQLDLADLEGVARWPEEFGTISEEGATRALGLLRELINKHAGGDRVVEARIRQALLYLEPLPLRDPPRARMELLSIATTPGAGGWAIRARYCLVRLDEIEGRRRREERPQERERIAFIILVGNAFGRPLLDELDYEPHDMAALLENQAVRHVHRKVFLPTYGLFDERCFFAPGSTIRAANSERLDLRLGISVCEDFWHLATPQLLALDGAQVLINVSSSPGRDVAAINEQGLGTAESWRSLNRTYAQLTTSYVIFVNRVGVDESITFWGGSEVVGIESFRKPFVDRLEDGDRPRRVLVGEELRERGELLGKATIYRTLALLVELGLATEHDFDEGFKRYQVQIGAARHDHLICTECGHSKCG